MASALTSAPLDVLLIEDRQPPPSILTHRLDERQRRRLAAAAVQADFALVLVPARQIRNEIDAEQSAAAQHARDGVRASPADRVRASTTEECRTAP